MSKTITIEEASKYLGCDMSCYDQTGGHYDNFSLSEYGILEYEYIPGPEYDDEKEYVVYQIDLETGMERHCGITPGCFFTDWA